MYSSPTDTFQYSNVFFPNIGTIDLDQVEDGRDGGNPEFDGEVTDQYTAEVTSPICDCDLFCIVQLYRTFTRISTLPR